MIELGLMVMTRGIADSIETDKNFSTEINKAFTRYLNQDWGDMCEEDKKLNDEAVELENDLEVGSRILAAYNTTKGKVYIITEWDRSATTILFADEY